MNSSQSIQIPLPEAAHAWARLFSSKQTDVPSGRKVYFNTLSGFAVDDYLQSLGIPTNLEGSDSWYPDATTPEDSADLELIGIGKIECRPILPTATDILFPESAHDDRIAYLAVRLAESLEFITIEGYLPYRSDRDFSKSILLSAFQPIDRLTDYLGMIRDGIELFNNEPDNEIVGKLLAQIEDRSIPKFVAGSTYIYQSENKTSRKKQSETVTLMKKERVLATSRGDNTQNHFTATDPELKQLASDWLKLLDTVWSK